MTGICQVKGTVAAACKELEDNTCTTGNDCCSGYCDDRNGAWAFGVCKPILVVTFPPIASSCKVLYDNTCTLNGQCCSGFCDDNNGAWAFGVCKPATTSIITACKVMLFGLYGLTLFRVLSSKFCMQNFQGVFKTRILVHMPFEIFYRFFSTAQKKFFFTNF